MRIKIWWLTVFLIMSLILLGFAIYLKKATFPFISMRYLEAPEDFNARENCYITFDIPLSKDFKESVNNDLKSFLPDDIKVFSVSAALACYVRSNLSPSDNAIHEVDNILKSKGEDTAICSGYAKFLAAAAQALGYKSRVVWLNGHTSSEIYYPEYGWVLVDTHGNLIFQDKQGRYVSVLDVVMRFDDVIPKRLDVSHPNNDPDYLSSGNYSVYDNNDVLVVLEGKRIFDFDLRTTSIFDLIQYLLGKEAIAKGIQYTAHGRTKLGNFKSKVYLIFLIEFLFLSVSLLISILFIRKRRRELPRPP